MKRKKKEILELKDEVKRLDEELKNIKFELNIPYILKGNTYFIKSNKGNDTDLYKIDYNSEIYKENNTGYLEVDFIPHYLRPTEFAFSGFINFFILYLPNLKQVYKLVGEVGKVEGTGMRYYVVKDINLVAAF